MITWIRSVLARKSSVACVAAACLAAVALAAVAPAYAAQSPTVLHVGWNQKLDSLNPFIGYQNVSYDVYHLNYDFLVWYDEETLQPVPGLATEWHQSDGGKTWTFTLRRDVKWHDGQPFTAKDVVFTFTYNKKQSAYSTYIEGIESVRALDDYTVEFRTTKPKAGMLHMWVPIVPEHIWSKVSPNDAARKFENDPPVIGTGPFQVVEFKRGQFVRMKANPSYWAGAPKVDEILFQMYENSDTMATELKTGALDFGSVAPATFRTLEEQPGRTAQLAIEPGFDELGFNCYDGKASLGNPVLRDPAFRRALNWAIDRERIAAIAYGGAAVPASSILPARYYDPGLDYHWQPADGEAYRFDMAKAGKLLDEAGYPDTDGDGIREANGKPISLRLWSVNEKPEFDATGKLITGWLREVGLDIDYQIMDDGALSDRMYNTKDGEFAPDYDMFIWGWTGDYDPGFLLSVFLTSQIESWSDCAWSSATYDGLFAEQDTTLDVVRRVEIVQEMQRILYDESPYIPLVYPETREVFNSGAWGGWTRQPTQSGTVDNRYTYLRVHPVTAEEAASGGVGMLPFAGAAVGTLAVVIVVIVTLRHSRAGRRQEVTE